MFKALHFRLLPVLALSLVVSFPGFARTIVIHPGSSIRAGLNEARSGDRVEVLPGVYREGAVGDLNALTINRSDIELIGVPSSTRPVVLENVGRQSFGIWVSPSDSAGPGPQADPEHPPCGLSGATIEGFALSGFTVRGFARDGVHLTCVDGFSITNNVADNNEIYGFFPVASRNGVIADNEVMNTARDAAIYVGQSDSVLIKHNRVHDNLLGIEIENSRNCSVIANEIYGNTFGLFVDIQPFLERNTQSGTVVALNQLHDNNRPNSSEPDDPLALLPPGIGILLVGADTTTVSGNAVTGNQFGGIAVVSFCLALALDGQPCTGLDIEPNPDGNRIVGNFVMANGTVPVPNPLLDALRADLVWDGSGIDNCWNANSFGTSVPPSLPVCP
jgi:parallel beta-helix repeat protein